MKLRVQLALVGAIFSVALHFYLTSHYYPIKFGMAAAQSVCNINAKFNCDAVSASSYSSALGIPVSLWGAATNLILFFFILLGWLEWSDHPERLRRWSVLLAGGSLAASVVMGAISVLALQNYCLFCIILYALSAVIFFACRGTLREPVWSNLKNDLPALPRESFGILSGLLLIPGLAFLMHKSFMDSLGDDEVNRIVQESVNEWLAAPKNEFIAKPSLSMGASADQATLTLVEFADFGCGHCKRASYSLDAFVKSHPDVRMEFYAFPLDGACNDKIEVTSGLSCRLAQAVVCAEKEGAGWGMHHALFEVQDDVHRLASTAELDVILSKEAVKLGLSWTTLEHCLVDPATLDAVKAQAKQGGLVNVNATPTIFANGRLLSRGQLIPSLQAARERALQLKSAAK